MASHHHHHGCCHPSTATTSTVCCYHPSYTSTCHHPPPPDPHLILHHPHPHPTQPHLYSPYSNPPCATQSFHQQQTQYQSPPVDVEREGYFRELLHLQRGELSHTQPIVSSLLRRITTLESSLRHHSSSRSQSLRDAAARTIQIHFRAFLVRRSRTLRQLKDLASIKSSINILKTSISDNNHLDPLTLSHKALHLLLKLDSIKGDDPMIRDGKKSITRELTRFMDLIEGVSVERFEFSSGFIKKHARHGESSKKSRDLKNQNMGNVSCPDLRRDKRLEDLVSRIEALYHKVPREEDGEEDEELESPRISSIGKNGVPQTRKGGFRRRPEGIQATVKKNVKFSEDGNVYYVPRSRNELVLIEDCHSDDGSDPLNTKKKLENVLRREAEAIYFKDTVDDEEAQSDDGDDQVSTKSSDDGERGPVYSAPVPPKMETRSELMDKRKTLKLVE